MSGGFFKSFLTFSCFLQASLQLLGERLNMGLMENSNMIPGSLMSFAGAGERFAPSEIRIAGGNHLPVFASENDCRASQGIRRVGVRRKEKDALQFKRMGLAPQEMERRGNVP